MDLERILGTYTEQRPGPLLICVGGMHGNEWAGVQALQLLSQMLEMEPRTNPSFEFYGRWVSITGNLTALAARTRYIERDLNRMWTDAYLSTLTDGALAAEDQELLALKGTIDAEIERWDGDQIILLDLHTTTAEGGIFTLPTNDARSIRIAENMHAPVITGLVDRLKGTMISYYTEHAEAKDIIGIVFEAGQHDDPLSVNRSIAAVVNCMREAGNVESKHIVNRHNALLVDYSRGLPRVARFVDSHLIKPGDQFAMVAGYKNFQEIEKGEVLATDINGPIVASHKGMILMPHYQPQGEDGFFIIRREK